MTAVAQATAVAWVQSLAQKLPQATGTPPAPPKRNEVLIPATTRMSVETMLTEKMPDTKDHILYGSVHVSCPEWATPERKEGRKEREKAEKKEGRTEGRERRRKGGRKEEGRKEGRKRKKGGEREREGGREGGGRKEGRREGRKEREREEGRKEGGKEGGREEGRKDYQFPGLREVQGKSD